MSQSLFAIKKLGLRYWPSIFIELIASKLLHFLSDEYKLKNKNLRFFYKQNIKSVKLKKGKWFIDYKGMKFVLRNNTSDIPVFNQVVVQGEYDPLFRFIEQNDINPKKMVDLGANIGLTSVLAKMKFPELSIQAVEPSKENCDMLRKNFELNNVNGVVHENGVWNESLTLSISTEFRDGESWSLKVVPDREGSIQAINLHDFYTNDAVIDILKIDIEGTEFKLFEKIEYSKKFLSRTRFLAIEIHDDAGSREDIISTLEICGFKFFDSGELTIGKNTNL